MAIKNSEAFPYEFAFTSFSSICSGRTICNAAMYLESYNFFKKWLKQSLCPSILPRTRYISVSTAAKRNVFVVPSTNWSVIGAIFYVPRILHHEVYETKHYGVDGDQELHPVHFSLFL